MSNYGLKVSQPDQDATIEDINKSSINSKHPFLKGRIQGSKSINITGPGNYIVTVNHGLNYPPAFLFFGEVNPATPGERYPGEFAASGAGGEISTDAAVTSTALFLGWQDTSSAPGNFATYPYVVNFYYYIFHERLDL
jgi:hypothetical protein